LIIWSLLVVVVQVWLLVVVAVQAVCVAQSRQQVVVAV
jgi:hypothetical protein